MTRIVSCQLTIEPGDLAGNAERATAAARTALADGADLIILPETALTGLSYRDAAEAYADGIGLDHPVLADWGRVVDGTDAVLVAGFSELGQDGLLYNSAALFDAAGLRTVYRKTHLWDEEKLYFTPGSAPPPVVDTAIGRVGVLICYDLEFPELTRSMALAGADILAVPTAWPVVDHPAGQPTFEVIIAQAAARVNHIAIATCDRAGVTRGQEWTAGTVVVGADGWIAASVDEFGYATADLDLHASRDKRLTASAHLFDDRRPELYGAVSRVSGSEQLPSDGDVPPGQ